MVRLPKLTPAHPPALQPGEWLKECRSQAEGWTFTGSWQLVMGVVHLSRAVFLNNMKYCREKDMLLGQTSFLAETWKSFSDCLKHIQTDGKADWPETVNPVKHIISATSTTLDGGTHQHVSTSCLAQDGPGMSAAGAFYPHPVSPLQVSRQPLIYRYMLSLFSEYDFE